MIEALITIVTGFVASLVTWLFARRKSLAEAKSAELDNYQKNAEYYQKMLDDLAARHSNVLVELREAYDTIRERNGKINELMDIVQNLTDELKKYKQLNGKA